MRSDGLCGKRIVLFRAQAGQTGLWKSSTLKDRDGGDFGNMFRAVQSLEKEKVGVNTWERSSGNQVAEIGEISEKAFCPTNNTMQR